MKRKISRKPPRFHEDDSVYFLTFATFRRRKILHSPGIPEMIVENLRFYGKNLRKLIAYTVQRDHMHLMVDVKSVDEMSTFLRDFKKWTAKKIREMVSVSSPIWLRGTMDHCIRDDVDYHNHLTYIFYNCWKHLGIKPRDFPYHNFLEFVKKGWFHIDFLGLDPPNDTSFDIYEKDPQ